MFYPQLHCNSFIKNHKILTTVQLIQTGDSNPNQTSTMDSTPFFPTRYMEITNT